MHWRKRTSIASALALAMLLSRLLSSQSAALSATDAAVLKSVDTHYNHLHSLRTAFTETYDGLGMHKSEAGTLLLSKPGRMRWAYTEPAGKLFILDGKYAWSYSPGNAQAQRVIAGQIDDLRSPLRLLLGHVQLSRELTHVRVTSQPDGFRIEGVPRGQEARLRHLTVLTTSGGTIQQLRLEESDGAVTDFRFSAMEENLPVKPADFLFTPPPGVPVVEGLPPI